MWAMRRKVILLCGCVFIIFLLIRTAYFFYLSIAEEVHCRREPRIAQPELKHIIKGISQLNEGTDADPFLKFEETLFGTADCRSDADDLGVSAEEDLLPDSDRIATMRGSVEGRLVNMTIHDWQKRFDSNKILYVEKTCCGDLTLADQTEFRISVSEYVTGLEPQSLRLGNFFYVPGIIYGYSQYIVCGEGCSGLEFSILLDMPFVGMSRIVKLRFVGYEWSFYFV
jgi:hypothetical protein